MAELIVALDVPDAPQALELAGQLAGIVSWFKVGLELFVNEGPAIVHRLKALEAKIFLDLKIYDIPRTAAAAATAAARMGVDLLSAHCQGGERMCTAMREALDASSARPPLLVGVTALTSFGPGEMPGIDQAPGVFGFELARTAASWGMQCVVCSPLEAKAVRGLGLAAVCPGIRPDQEAAGDQRRIATPARAVAAGASYLVVGRPITCSVDPRGTAERILKDMDSAVSFDG